MSETKLQAAILAYLEAHPDVHAIRVNSGSPSRRFRGAPAGTSDILACGPQGRFLALEVKLPGESPSKKQSAFLGAIQALGGFACVVTSVRDTIEAVLRAGRGEVS